jgi:hypothetical protein
VCSLLQLAEGLGDPAITKNTVARWATKKTPVPAAHAENIVALFSDGTFEKLGSGNYQNKWPHGTFTEATLVVNGKLRAQHAAEALQKRKAAHKLFLKNKAVKDAAEAERQAKFDAEEAAERAAADDRLRGHRAAQQKKKAKKTALEERGKQLRLARKAAEKAGTETKKYESDSSDDD